MKNCKTSRTRRAFTLLEMLISILLIGIVMALVIGGALSVTNAARAAADRAAIGNIKTGLAQFETEFGFGPPLVKENAVPAAQPVTTTNPRRINVYDITKAADQQALRTSASAPTALNPLLDNRYSELSLSYYLAGGLDEKLSPLPTAPSIDGVSGPGLYKPTRDGSFEIPADVKRGTAPPPPGEFSNRTGKSYAPFVNLGNAVKLFTDPTDTKLVKLQDRKGVPIRFYRWMTGREEPVGSGIFVVETPADLNIPPIVARDYSDANFAYFKRRPGRDLADPGAAAVKGASWAIVSAGPNGLFGDEQYPGPLTNAQELAQRLGVSVKTEPEMRALAEEDNIVEVGP